MSVTAGALSKVLVGQTTANLSSAVATGGTGPYTYQWYQSTTSGFVAGAGNLVSGATSLTYNASGLLANTNYYFLVIATDTGAGNATSTSSQLTVLTEPALSQNQFAQAPVVGLVDLKVGSANVISCQVDVSVTSQIYPGQAVKIVSNTNGGTPKVAPVSSKSDQVFGVAIFNVKDIQYTSPGNLSAFATQGQTLEVAMFGTVIWQFATGAITQMTCVSVDPTYIGGVQASGNSATYMGLAIDGTAAAGQIRVMLVPNPLFATN
jgi:hypothetical protein